MHNRKRHIAVRELPLANESINYWIYRLHLYPPLFDAHARGGSRQNFCTKLIL